MRLGASITSWISAVSQGRIAQMHAFWLPSDGMVSPPWAEGTVRVRDFWSADFADAKIDGDMKILSW